MKFLKTPSSRRLTATQRGYNSQWSKAAAAFRDENPLCRMCQRIGKLSRTQCVDHVIPWKGDSEKFWDVDNWQPLCFQCHAEKTIYDANGWCCDWDVKPGVVVLCCQCHATGMKLADRLKAVYKRSRYEAWQTAKQWQAELVMVAGAATTMGW